MKCKHNNEHYCGHCGDLDQEMWFRYIEYLWDHTCVGEPNPFMESNDNAVAVELSEKS